MSVSMIRRVKWLAILGVVVLVGAIGVGLFVRSCNADKADAEKAVEGFYSALAREDYEGALEYYHPDNWSQLGREEMLSELKAIHSETGNRLSGRQVGWFVNKGSGARVELTYENRYERVSTVEEFVLVRLDGEFRILVHTYYAPAE